MILYVSNSELTPVDNEKAWDDFYTYFQQKSFETTQELCKTTIITDYIESKGYTVQECSKPAKKEVPANMRHRYSTYEEYQEALHDFLNGM